MLCSVVIFDGSAPEVASKPSRQCGPCHTNVGVRPAFLTVACVLVNDMVLLQGRLAS